jgi:hypothetical protein
MVLTNQGTEKKANDQQINDSILPMESPNTGTGDVSLIASREEIDS